MKVVKIMIGNAGFQRHSKDLWYMCNTKRTFPSFGISSHEVMHNFLKWNALNGGIKKACFVDIICAYYSTKDKCERIREKRA